MKEIRRILLASIIALAMSCEKNGNDENLTGTLNTVVPTQNKISLEHLPKDIKSFMTTNFKALKEGGQSGKSEDNFGEPAGDVIEEVFENGFSSYTIDLENTAPGLYYDNVVISEEESGDLAQKIVRYTLSIEWFVESFDTERKYENYTGGLEVFDAAGSKIMEASFVNGVANTKDDDTTTGKTCSVKKITHYYGCVATCWLESVSIDITCNGANGSNGSGSAGTSDTTVTNDPNNVGSGGSGGGFGGSSGGGSRGDGPIKTSPHSFVVVPPPSCTSFQFYQKPSNNTQTAAVTGVTMNIVAIDPVTKRYIAVPITFTQPIYFTISRFHSVEGNLTSGLGQNLAARALYVAHSRAKAYFKATQASVSQVRAKTWEYI